MPVSRQRFQHVLVLSTFLALPQFSAAAAAAACAIHGPALVPDCIASPLKLGRMMLQEMTLPLAT